MILTFFHWWWDLARINYAVIIERGADGGFGGHVPDLPATVGSTESLTRNRSQL